MALPRSGIAPHNSTGTSLKPCIKRTFPQWQSSLQLPSFQKTESLKIGNYRRLSQALEAGIVPVIYGDMAFDSIKGGAVLSTETLMFYLAHHLEPTHILLAGIEAAVWADFPARQQRVEKVTPSSYKELANKVGGSHGVDVTGGMKSKVEEMLSLVGQIRNLNVQIFSGEEVGNVTGR